MFKFLCFYLGGIGFSFGLRLFAGSPEAPIHNPLLALLLGFLFGFLFWTIAELASEVKAENLEAPQASNGASEAACF